MSNETFGTPSVSPCSTEKKAVSLLTFSGQQPHFYVSDYLHESNTKQDYK